MSDNDKAAWDAINTATVSLERAVEAAISEGTRTPLTTKAIFVVMTEILRAVTAVHRA